MALTLALTIPFNLLTGCGASKKDEDKEETDNKTFEEVIATNNISPEDLTKFYTEMASIIPLYNLEGKYTDATLKEEAIKEEGEKVACSFKETDFITLYDTIIKNSITGIKSKYQVIKEDTKTKSYEEKKYNNLVRIALHKALSELLAEDLYTNEDMHQLNAIKICLTDEVDNKSLINLFCDHSN